MRTCTVLVLAGAMTWSSTARGDDGGLACGGFETCAFVPGFASTFGIWGTDVMEITGAQQGITPLEGDKMLHFQCTFIQPPCNTGGTGSDTQQLVDLGPFAELVASGSAVAVATASFNRVAGDAQTDT
ncbi:MAG: hypothetical protein KDA22_13510, partial [Phycisphaerales bacterium]|nr:hypothetical protein [Phycisphaerales bacterium]